MDELNYKELYEKSIIEINELKEHLKKYTAPKRSKTYYENKKEEINEKNKEYHKTIPADKIKEYSKRAYEKKKQKMPKCIKCNLFNFSNKEEQLCSYCDTNNKKLYATKEMKVVTFLSYNNLKLTHNKSIGFECGNYRPDILIDCNTHFVVIEVDENQHDSYDINCEMARMNNIYISLGLPVVFLRYNPDEFYFNDELIKVNSEKRLNYLYERIKFYQEYDKINNPVIIEKLFYNNISDKEYKQLINFTIDFN